MICYDILLDLVLLYMYIMTIKPGIHPALEIFNLVEVYLVGIYTGIPG